MEERSLNQSLWIALTTCGLLSLASRLSLPNGKQDPGWVARDEGGARTSYHYVMGIELRYITFCAFHTPSLLPHRRLPPAGVGPVSSWEQLTSPLPNGKRGTRVDGRGRGGTGEQVEQLSSWSLHPGCQAPIAHMMAQWEPRWMSARVGDGCQ